MAENKRIVAIAGNFDPLHKFHLAHMKKARELGDKVIVIVQNDECVRRKNGYIVQTLRDRMALIEPYPFVDEVVANIDHDGTCAKTLRMVRPQIFAKGDDRNPDNMPKQEIAVCKELGILIVYGVGVKGASSRGIMRKVVEQILCQRS